MIKPKNNKLVTCINCHKDIDLKEAIQDQYKNLWCPKCADEFLKICDKCHALCEKDTMEPTEDGKFYCENCITYCIYCDKPILLEDQILDNNNDSWCPECAKKHLAECENCHQLCDKENFITNDSDGKKYCNKCTITCCHCHKPLFKSNPETIILDCDHDPWCHECEEKFLENCDGCDLLFPNEDLHKYKNGNYCEECMRIIQGKNDD